MSFGSGDAAVSGLKNFVTEDEIEEKRKIRQEEWEKVRKPEDPIEAPEEAIDNRSLYDRLQEQKDKKQSEYEEQFKLKNQVKGLDEDESHFLDFVSQRQQDIDKKREQETDSVLQEYRDTVVHKAASASPSKSSSKQEKKPPPVQGRKSQTALLAGAIKRKASSETSDDTKKLRPSDSAEKSNKIAQSIEIPGVTATSHEIKGQTAQVIGILPGIGTYSDSDNSSSDSDDINTDLFVSGEDAFSQIKSGAGGAFFSL